MEHNSSRSVWVPPQPVLKSSEEDKQSKAACRASAREDSSPEVNKALSDSLLPQVAQLTARVSLLLLLAIQAQLLHRDLGA